MGFAAIYVPDFMVQAVVRAEPGLRNCAIALLDGTPPLRTVVAANETALRAGIALGMTESQAEDFCMVQTRLRAPAQEKTAHAALMDLGWSVSPRVEDTAPDTIVLDLAGLISLFGSEEIIAEQLIEGASRLGLAARVGIASNLEATIHAARGFPGVTLIPAGEESKWLGGLPVSVLFPLGTLSTHAEILETLEGWGVHTCAALAALPVLQLSERLGQEGVRLHELARGASLRSLALADPDIHFEEGMELEDSVPELEPLSFLLGRLLDQLCARLAARSLAASAIRVRFELEPVSESNVRSLNDASPRKAAPPTYEKILTLPVPMRNSKTLLKLLRLHLQSDPPETAVAKLFMAAEPAKPRFAQGGLFLPSSPDPEKLELTIARLANLVGDSNVGAPELAETHRPDEFRMRRFVAPRVAPEIVHKMPGANRKPGPARASMGPADMDAIDTGINDSQSRAHRTRISFRVFRPSLPAAVEMREGRLARVSFSGVRGEVLAASGPWRTSGDWWREDAWEHDEWDIAVRFGPSSFSSSGRRESISHASLFLQKDLRLPAQRGLYRIFYDTVRGSWFVRGMYD
ncbi:MAG: DNA polymerase Y family protein [Candidatus Acidiferrales bacterium]